MHHDDERLGMKEREREREEEKALPGPSLFGCQSSFSVPFCSSAVPTAEVIW